MMDFGEALRELKAGKRVARTGWNGRGMWLVLLRPQTGVGTASGLYWGVSIVSRDELAWPTPHLLPWIGMKTADNGFVPWLCSQTDALAEDWEIV